MNTASSHPAELADRHASLFGIAVLLVALKFAVSATMHFTDAPTTAILDKAELVLALGGAGLVLAVLVWKRRALTPSQRHAYFADRDSFVFEAIQRARISSWNLTFLALITLEIFADDTDRVSADFFVQVALAVLLGVFGLKFFVLMRDSGDEDDGDDDA